MPPTRLQRQLDLIAYLVGRRFPVSVDELMRQVPGYAVNWEQGTETAQASARRAFERDKDALRNCGIPLKTVKYQVDGQDTEGYEIRRLDFYLPYLKLVSGDPNPGPQYRDRHRPAEVEIAQADAPLAFDALLRVADVPSFPLAAEARSAFRKLAFDLELPATTGHPRPLFMERPGVEDQSEQLRLLTDALQARKRVTFRYHGIYRDQETERDVAAYGLMFQSGHWYLIAHDAMRQGERVFRVGRMSEINVNSRAPNQPDYEIPANFKLADYADRKPWELGEQDERPLEVQVAFRFPRSLWAERNGHGNLLETRADGSAVRSFQVLQVGPFLRWILSLDGEAEVVAPPQLRTQLRELAQAIVAAHGEVH